MKTLIPARKMALALGLLAASTCLAPTPASAGLFHKRTVVVESPAVYVAPVPTVYAAPVTTVYSAPAPVTYSAPVVDSAVVPTAYVPTVSTTVVPSAYVPTSVVTTPITTTYVPTVTTVVPSAVEVRQGLFGRTRVRYYGY